MKISTHRFHLASRSKLTASAAAVLAVTCIMGAMAGTADAKRQSPHPLHLQYPHLQ